MSWVVHEDMKIEMTKGDTPSFAFQAFLPDGSVVYQQYINDDPTSIVSNLKNIGYTTVAMHPYYATGWSRNKVYPHLGYH